MASIIIVATIAPTTRPGATMAAGGEPPVKSVRFGNRSGEVRHLLAGHY